MIVLPGICIVKLFFIETPILLSGSLFLSTAATVDAVKKKIKLNNNFSTHDFFILHSIVFSL